MGYGITLSTHETEIFLSNLFSSFQLCYRIDNRIVRTNNFSCTCILFGLAGAVAVKCELIIYENCVLFSTINFKLILN